MATIRTLPALPILLALMTCIRGTPFLAGAARAERIALDRPVLRFGAGALGGIRTVLRYGLPAPSHSNAAILFLDAPTRPGDAPSAVQVLGGRGEATRLQLQDSEGGDCTLARVGLYRVGKAVAVVEAARRWTYEGPSFAEPDVMEVRVFQLGLGSGMPGDSSLVFRLQGTPTVTGPLCALRDVDAALDAAARRWRPETTTRRH